MHERIAHTKELEEQERIDTIETSSTLIGRSVFFSVIIMIISFSPLLFLSGQEKKLFTPLVLTKTFSLIGAALLAITVSPMLSRIFIRGRLVPESKNPVSNYFVRLYQPVVRVCQTWKKTTLAAAAALVIVGIPFIFTLGTEFMPPLDEGSILFMPVTLPDASNTEVKRILQVQDRILSAIPEVENVLGKAGRAYTATDNAPISMIESIILLKPRSEWRSGMTTEKLIAEMDEKVKIPGVTAGWTQPIINRINMLSTGIRTDVGVKIYGQNLDTIYSIAREVKNALVGIDGLQDLYVEQLVGGKYLDVVINKSELGRYGLNVESVNMLIEAAIGGMKLTSTVEGRSRFSVNLRLAQDYRNSIKQLERLPLQTTSYGVIPLSAVAELRIAEGPPMINSENAMLRGTVLFNVRGRDMGSVVNDAKQKVEAHFNSLPPGYYINWSGQYENQVRAQKRLSIIIPIVLVVIGFILYVTFHSWKEVALVFVCIPVALIGGVYSLLVFDINFSVAVAAGFIALFGVSVETGVLMIAYINATFSRLSERGTAVTTVGDIKNAIIEGAVPRVRPLLMTVLANILGLLPILLSTGTGSDVMKPIAVPFVFGLITSTLFVLIVLPVMYQVTKEFELRRRGSITVLRLQE